MKTHENNTVLICGTIAKEPIYNHQTCGEKFNRMFVSVLRASDVEDVVPVIVSERIFRTEDLHVGDAVRIYGCYRSFSRHDENGKSHVILNVFAEELELLDGIGYENSIELNGFICKEPVYRKTPKGREVCDCLIAVNRQYGKSDYIPSIAWGRSARYLAKLPLGTNIKLTGRIQSRKYVKKVSENESEVRVAYEVSITAIEVIRESEE